MLRNSDDKHSLHYTDRWFQNIASKNAAEFLRDIWVLDYPSLVERCEWSAVVLMPEESELHVGGMSVTELRQQLENYWGRGSIPGAKDYQNMTVWGTSEDVSNPEMVSYWLNRECTQWLSYFITKNHTLGVVHAWFTAFLGVIRESMPDLEGSFKNIAQSQDAESMEFMESIHRVKFRMSFDVCIEGHDEVVDGLPSLPSNTLITTNEKGMQVIHSHANSIFP